MTANLPGPGALVLDHSGHFVADADAARAALVALGFTVTPFSAQVVPDPATGREVPTGTGNICVMLSEGYLEFLVQTADTPLGREFRAALDRRAGLHLAAFGVADAGARHAALVATGHTMRPLVQFSRPVATGTGQAVAAFTVARLAAGAMAEGRVQMVTHHDPAAMWQPRWTVHANGALGLRAIVISAPDPGATAARYARLLGAAALPMGGGSRIALGRGAVEILPEAEAMALVGHPVEPGRSVFAALRVAVADLDALADRAGSGARRAGDSLCVPFGPALGPGAWLFEPG